ncbi:GNAT family N-acetyltransferase [Streptomyces sp. NPDC001339]|uniref:GNAT family N-acetyltransferase n=1 Tax=Streptomyces sp. NPDC001339 TaxID=3364563 RepID=UPI003679E89A
MNTDSIQLHQATTPHAVGPQLRSQLIDCWIEVTNAGGAAGFPFPPIDAQQAAPGVDAIIDSLAPDTCRLVMALAGGELVGWLNIRCDTFALVAHWGTLHHVQTRPAIRGRGVGAALVDEARRIAREEMGLEQLRLAARGGMGLEDFYGRLGWKEIGRWPGALRLSPDDDRDEVLMVLKPLAVH